MASITDFANYQAVARANQFKVTMPFPYAQVGGEQKNRSYVRQTNLPEMTIGTVEVPLG